MLPRGRDPGRERAEVRESYNDGRLNRVRVMRGGGLLGTNRPVVTREERGSSSGGRIRKKQFVVKKYRVKKRRMLVGFEGSWGNPQVHSFGAHHHSSYWGGGQ